MEGSCDPRFADVDQEFKRNFAERGEVGASVCVILDGQVVVDLWGGVADPASGRPWKRDTVGLVFSCTKGATALCVHLLADRGEVDLDAPVTRYWPEFGAAGKDGVTVRMLLTHQAAVPALRPYLPSGAFYDWDQIVGLLAAEAPFWDPGTQHGYHAITFGFLVGEVVRRVTGQSLGQFFAAEVAGPLGLDFWIGLPEEVEARVAPTTLFDPSTYTEVPEIIMMALADPQSIPGLLLMNTAGLFNPGECDSRAAHGAELPAVNGITNARGLAGMYAPLSLGGAIGATRLVGGATLADMAAVRSASSRDPVTQKATRFSSGFMKAWPNGPGGNSIYLAEEAFGHAGMGGSVGFADPRSRLAFGYTMNQHGPGIALNSRGQSLVDATYRALGYTTGPAGTWL